MATLVFFHAHPDDEAIATAGTMAALAQAGHRVVTVFATRGERGTVPARLDGHASLGELRETEAQRAGRILRTHRVAFLGYDDSGPDPAAVPPGSFAAASPDEAAGLLAAVLLAEAADAVVTYDPTGTTRHPDHLQTHLVGRRAAELVRPWPRVYECTISGSQLQRFVDRVGPLEHGLHATPDDQVTTTVDVGPWLVAKRAAMAAHASQVPPESWFLTLGDDDFAAIWGREHYIDRAAARLGPGPLEAALAQVAGTGTW